MGSDQAGLEGTIRTHAPSWRRYIRPDIELTDLRSHKIASDYVAAFDKIIVAYARIAEPLARFRIIETTYFNNAEVQNTLAVFYSDILRFHTEAYKFVNRGGESMVLRLYFSRY
jgi:hypothetical protein